jgi:hypothetical protein
MLIMNNKSSGSGIIFIKTFINDIRLIPRKPAKLGQFKNEFRTKYVYIYICTW